MHIVMQLSLRHSEGSTFVSRSQLPNAWQQGGVFQTLRCQVGYCPKLLPSLTVEWLERLSPVPGVMGLNLAVSVSSVSMSMIVDT